MKSGALLSSNLPRVIDRSNLWRSGEVINLIGRRHEANYCEIIYFRGAQFSWIHENGYIRGDVISWVGWLV